MRRSELHPRTEAINKAQKNQSKLAKNTALVWLAATFPQAFDNTSRIRPLKAGIMHDILQHADKAEAVGISRSKIREAVVLFTRRLDYLICLKAKEMRIDLDGNPVTPVTAEEAERAALKIKKRIEKSARNAHKTTSAYKPISSALRQTNSKTNYYVSNNDTLIEEHAFDRLPRIGTANSSNTTPKPTIIIKNKLNRQFDSTAVARLKEKLGLARKEEEEHNNA